MDTKIWKGIEQDSQPLELLVQLGFPQISQDDLSLAKQLTDVRYHIEHDECILAHQKYTIAQTLLENNPIAQEYASVYLKTLGNILYKKNQTSNIPSTGI